MAEPGTRGDTFQSDPEVSQERAEEARRWDRRSKKLMNWAVYILIAACAVMVLVVILWGAVGNSDNKWQTAWMAPAYLLIITSGILMLVSRKYHNKYYSKMLELIEEDRKKIWGKAYMEDKRN
jgi:predicted ferric reductase